MKVYVFIYETFAQFEVVLSTYFLGIKGDIITVGIENSPVLSGEGFKTIPHKILKDVDPSDVDLFILPGGEPSEIKECEQLYLFLNELNKIGKKLQVSVPE